MPRWRNSSLTVLRIESKAGDLLGGNDQIDGGYGNDILIGNYDFKGTMPVGLYFERTIPLLAPRQTGSYWVVVQTDVADTVAEGIETRSDWNLLKELGCTIAQGYYIAKPMSAADFLDWVPEWTAPE